LKPPLNTLKGVKDRNEKIRTMLLSAQYYRRPYFMGLRIIVKLDISKHPFTVYNSQGDYYIYYRDKKKYVPRAHKIYSMRDEDFILPPFKV
jgi:hypothetical protein